jgi:tRNA (mo5U34)-methyltransferase
LISPDAGFICQAMEHARDEGASRREIEARIRAHPYWYHRIALPEGIETPGWAPVDAGAYRIPERLDGKRVLDVGAWDGYWSFEALKRGAREVVAIDDFSDDIGALVRAERHAWATFDLCRELLGFDAQRCRREQMSVYEVSEARLGRFDVVFFFGTLYHLRHPLLALDKLGAVSDAEIYVESAICDDFSPYRGGVGQGYDGGQMVMEFYPRAEYGENVTNWWAPTLTCMGHMIASAGFPRVKAWKLVNNPPDVSYCRGFVRGTKPQA